MAKTLHTLHFRQQAHYLLTIYPCRVPPDPTLTLHNIAASVRLIGGTKEVRERNASIVNKAYKIRSRLVHTGHVNANKTETLFGQAMSHFEIIDYTISLCSDLIKVIMLQGSIPDWPSFDITEQTQ